MSVIIDIKDFAENGCIDKLTVQKKPTKYNQNPPPIFLYYELASTVALDERFIAVPLSYYYQFLRPKEIGVVETKDPYIQHSFTFMGKLTNAQTAYLPTITETLERTHSILISFHCGFGKTITAIYLAAMYRMRTLIIIPGKNILIQQWLHSLAKFCPGAQCQMITAKNAIKQDMDFYITNGLNLTKRDPKDFFGIGTLIVDEAHLFCSEKNYKSFLNIYPKYSIALTATPQRPDGLQSILGHFFGFEMVSKKLFRPFIYKLYKTNFFPQLEQNAVGGLDWNIVLDSMSADKGRNNLIVKTALQLPSRNILILCKRKEQVDLIYNDLRQYGENVSKFYGSEKYYDVDTRILVSTYSKSGVGFDFPKLDTLIIACSVLEGIEQYIGRVFRREDTTPLIIDFIDKFGGLVKHQKLREEIYKSMGGMKVL